MAVAWTRITSVKDDGIVELTIPELSRGQVVGVSVQVVDDPKQGGGTSLSSEDRPLGLLKGKVTMRDDFDARMSEFDEYT